MREFEGFPIKMGNFQWESYGSYEDQIEKNIAITKAELDSPEHNLIHLKSKIISRFQRLLRLLVVQTRSTVLPRERHCDLRITGE